MTKVFDFRSTVGIPLHNSATWIDNVIRNIEKLSTVAQVLVSDHVENDDTLQRVKQKFLDHSNVSFLGKRPGVKSWAEHCNQLRDSCTTEFFMWLPHDDEVGTDWITRGQHALDANQEAVLAVGSLRRVTQHDEEKILIPSLENEILDPVERMYRALLRQFVSGDPGFGESFRGLQRTALTPRLPDLDDAFPSHPKGWKADVFWSIEALSLGPFVAIDAEYRKLFYPTSESATWEMANNVPGFRVELLKRIQHLSQEDRVVLLSRVWDAEASRLRDIHGRQKRRIESLVLKGDNFGAQ